MPLRDPARPGVPGPPAGRRPRSIWPVVLVLVASTATKGEALVAAWALALYRRDGEDIRPFSTAARRTAQFQMRVQNVEDQAGLYPVPEHVLGSWSQSPVIQRVRLDYVQHNISALMGVAALTQEEDLPLATPLS